MTNEYAFYWLLILLPFLVLHVNEINATIFSEEFVFSPTAADEPDGYLEDQLSIIFLEGVYYKSDGKFLDARMKLYGSSGLENGNIISYGMVIDYDANYKTGIRGFDYKYHIQWKDGTWYEIYEELPSYKKTSNLKYHETVKYDVFDEENSFIHLQLDLSKIGNPEFYNVFFFTQSYLAEDRFYKPPPYVHDVTSLVIIPPPNFSIQSLPAPLLMESGTKLVADLILESKLQGNTEIFYGVSTPSEDVTIEKILSSVFLQNGRVEIPIKLSLPEHEGILPNKNL